MGANTKIFVFKAKELIYTGIFIVLGVLFVLLLIVCVMLTGCRLATEEVYNDGMVNHDELVGMVVTTEYLDLFDIEAFLKDNPQALKGGEIDTAGYQGRIYAQAEIQESTTEDGVPCTTTYYNFDHVDGMALLYYHTQTVLEDGSVLADTVVGDCSDGILRVAYRGDLIEGTIYVPVGEDACVFFLNPVYQDEDGRVYLVAGTGIAHENPGDAIWSMWQNIVEEYTETVDGETTTRSREVKIIIQATRVTDRLAVIQMSGENFVLDRKEYLPEELPETLTPVEGCAYILVEEYAGENLKRTMIEPDERHISVFVRSDKPYCIAAGTEILWPET